MGSEIVPDHQPVSALARRRALSHPYRERDDFDHLEKRACHQNVINVGLTRWQPLGTADARIIRNRCWQDPIKKDIALRLTALPGYHEAGHPQKRVFVVKHDSRPSTDRPSSKMQMSPGHNVPITTFHMALLSCSSSFHRSPTTQSWLTTALRLARSFEIWSYELLSLQATRSSSFRIPASFS